MNEDTRSAPLLSVAICCHNPNPSRLAEVLHALATQSLPKDQWECLLIDNASTALPDLDTQTPLVSSAFRILREETLGLSHARRRALREAQGELVVFVDDDNLLAPNYLEQALRHAREHLELGAWGGPVVARFELEPPAWTKEFHGLLALRDLGPAPLFSAKRDRRATGKPEYPACAPIGAGMVLRKKAVLAWLDHPAETGPSDRQGTRLSSAGDCDIVISLLRHGWRVAYFPDLLLTHLIPDTRLAPDYLAALNRGIQESWLRLLCNNGMSPWAPLSERQARLRKLKAWLTQLPFLSKARRVRYAGACGHFDGRVDETASPHRT